MKKKFKEKLEYIAKTWQIQLCLEKTFSESNIRLAFKDIGAICELLAINYNPGFFGGGSGGMGVDLFNPKTKKCVEVKSCCTIQNAVCNECGMKFNDLFLNKCPKCGSKNFKQVNDSRFGIDAKEFLRVYNLGRFENFTMCCLSLYKHDANKSILTIRMEWYKIEFNNKNIVAEQIKYFQNQDQFGRKSHCNLLPNNFDFYKLCPSKIDDILIEIDYRNLYKIPKIIKNSFDKKVKVPLKVIPKDMILNFKKLKTYSNKMADVTDFTTNIPYKKKNLGKVRGDTRKKVDKIYN